MFFIPSATLCATPSDTPSCTNSRGLTLRAAILAAMRSGSAIVRRPSSRPWWSSWFLVNSSTALWRCSMVVRSLKGRATQRLSMREPIGDLV